MSEKTTLFQKVWDEHVVVPESQDTPAILYIDLHIVHEVTTPQAFSVLRQLGLPVRRPDLTLATLVNERPELASHLDALGLDFCCGGRRRLVDAVDEIGLDLAETIATLQAIPGAAETTDIDAHNWTALGRAEHNALRAYFYALDGRRNPTWVPTFFDDFVLIEAAGNCPARPCRRSKPSRQGPRVVDAPLPARLSRSVAGLPITAVRTAAKPA